MTSDKKFFRQFIILTLTSILTFVIGSLLGWAIMLMNKFLNPELIPNELLTVAWSLWWGVSAYSMLFEINDEGKHKLQRKMLFYTLTYATGTYLALYVGEKPMSANIFCGTATLGLLLVLTAPPFIEKYLKHKFIQRAR